MGARSHSSRSPSKQCSGSEPRQREISQQADTEEPGTFGRSGRKSSVGKARTGRLDATSRRKLVAWAGGEESLQQQGPPEARERRTGTDWSKSGPGQEHTRARERELTAANMFQSEGERFRDQQEQESYTTGTHENFRQ